MATDFGDTDNIINSEQLKFQIFNGTDYDTYVLKTIVSLFGNHPKKSDGTINKRTISHGVGEHDADFVILGTTVEILSLLALNNRSANGAMTEKTFRIVGAGNTSGNVTIQFDGYVNPITITGDVNDVSCEAEIHIDVTSDNLSVT